MNACLGPPLVQKDGGLRAQLMRLRAGIHPVTLQRLPEATWEDGSPIDGVGGYKRRRGSPDHPPAPVFAEYVPEMFRPCVPNTGGKNAVQKRECGRETKAG